MTKLKELHDLVKDHPYRMPSVTNNDAYKSSYIKLYRKLLSEIYDYAKDGGFEPIVNKGVMNMYHDVMSATCHIKNNLSDSNDCLIYLDQCLSVIHRVIEFGEMPYYYVYRDKEAIQMRLSKKRDAYYPYYRSRVNYLKIIDDYKSRWVNNRDTIQHIIEYYQEIYDNYDERFGVMDES